MLTDYVLGLCKVAHCGRVCYLLWSASVFSSIHARSLILLVLRLLIVSITHFEFVAVDEPWFGLLLSCFGHARAKNNSELSCGLNGVLLLFGTVTRLFCLLHKAVKGCFAAVCSGWSMDY